MSLEDDELKGDEIEVEMKLDSADSDLILSAMVERLPAEYRVSSPSHTSDTAKQGSNVES